MPIERCERSSKPDCLLWRVDQVEISPFQLITEDLKYRQRRILNVRRKASPMRQPDLPDQTHPLGRPAQGRNLHLHVQRRQINAQTHSRRREPKHRNLRKQRVRL